MKNSRGNLHALITLIVLLPVILWGEDFRFTVDAHPRTPYLNAPVRLNIDLNQTNHNVVLLYRFGIVPSPDYRIVQIDGRHDDTLYHAHHHYLYELYPLRTGDINITFDMLKRVTDEKKITYSGLGDRDDFKKLQSTDYKITLPPLRLHVKPLPKETQLVGTFTLQHTFAKTHVEAFEPIPVKIVIEGRGYPPVLKQIFPSLKGVHLFSQKPEIQRYPGKEGIRYKVTYPLAFSAAKSFDLPEVTLRALNPDTGAPYTLTIPSQHFEVTPADVNTLVDKVDTPPSLKEESKDLVGWLGYLLAFAAGFLSAKFIALPTRRPAAETDPLVAKIDRCRDKRALLGVLMAHNAQRFSSVIEKLEHDLYGNESHTLKQLKQQAKEQLT